MVGAIRQLFGALPSLEDPHIEFTLLRSCFAFPKFAFSLRTTNTCAHQEVRWEFDVEVKKALEEILGAPLTYSQWVQASLPVSKGGFGLPSTERHSSAAFLASLVTSQPLVEFMRGEGEESGEEEEVMVMQVPEAE